KVDERELLRVPQGLTLREAALAEPLAVALHGITNSGVQPGQRALVLGAGPIGALTIAALRAMGIDDVKVSEPSPARGSWRSAWARRTSSGPRRCRCRGRSILARWSRIRLTSSSSVRVTATPWKRGSRS